MQKQVHSRFYLKEPRFMNRKKQFISIITIFLFLFFGTSKAEDLPFEVSEIYSPNTITNYKGQKLILIDFWATWCVPCRPATIQLEILQEQFQDELFIVSVTNESKELVNNYIEKTPIELMVILDIQNNLIQKFDVRSRPYAVLLTSDGEVVWKGHPSDLSKRKIEYFHDHNKNIKSKKEIEEIFITPNKTKEEAIEKTKIHLKIEEINESPLTFYKDTLSVFYEGPLIYLITQINQVPKTLVKDNSKNKDYIRVESPLDEWNNEAEKILDTLENQFDISISSKTKKEEAFVFEVGENSKLWDVDQINWGDNRVSNYLIGEDRLQADNYTIADVCILLSNLKNKTYSYTGNDKNIYDWDFHFKFDALMKEELLTEFGIVLEKKEVDMKYLVIDKK